MYIKRRRLPDGSFIYVGINGPTKDFRKARLYYNKKTALLYTDRRVCELVRVRLEIGE